MIEFYGICNECGEESMVSVDADNPIYCPECLSVDCIEEVE